MGAVDNFIQSVVCMQNILKIGLVISLVMGDNLCMNETNSGTTKEGFKMDAQKKMTKKEAVSTLVADFYNTWIARDFVGMDETEIAIFKALNLHIPETK